MPRPAPTRSDPTARRFLDAAAQLIDAMFVESAADRPPRLRSIKFPAAMDWIRIQDVIRLAGEAEPGISRKAFFARWPTKDDFLIDAVQHAVLSRDDPSHDPTFFAERLPGEVGGLSATMVALADGLYAHLVAHPRSYLAMHLGPTLDQHERLRAAIAAAYREHGGDQLWLRGYALLIERYGVRLRPGWTLERLHESLMAMLDGCLLRTRMDRDKMADCRWEEASMLAEMVLAFTLGIVDTEGTDASTATALDAATRASR